jgi:hypothetical protein
LPHWPAAALVVMGAGQAIVQPKPTTTLNEQLPVLPDRSLAEQLTVVVPTAKLDPDGGVQVTARAPSQASLADVEKVTVAEPEPGGLSTAVTGEVGQLRTGAWLSLTVTVKLHELLLLEVSDAPQLTVVVPFANELPDGGVQVTVRAPSQLSAAVIAG